MIFFVIFILIFFIIGYISFGVLNVIVGGWYNLWYFELWIFGFVWIVLDFIRICYVIRIICLLDLISYVLSNGDILFILYTNQS
jgi:hypothetical protein